MQNYISYFNHTKFTPNYYYQQFENCLPKEESLQKISYVAQVAMPLISLHKPANQALSFISLSMRLITNISSLKNSEFLSQEAFKNMIATSLTTLSFAANFYNFTAGLYLTTIADIAQNLMHIYNHQFDEVLPLIASSLYLAIIYTGSLEIILASLVIQIVVNGSQAYKEAKKGDWVMALSKTIMMCMRGQQAQCQLQLIQRRNYLYQLSKFQDLIERIEKATKVEDLYEHPLADLSQEVEKATNVDNPDSRPLTGLAQKVEKVKNIDDLYEHPLVDLTQKIKERTITLVDIDDSSLDLGAHFSRIGKDIVKGMNVTFKMDEKQIELQFKINHVVRQTLDAKIEDLKTPELGELLASSSCNFKDIKVLNGENTEDLNWFFPSEENHVIEFEGLGTITVGKAAEIYNDYNTVKITMGRDKSLYDFHEVLCMLDLEQALRISSSQDIEHLKLNQLFRLYNPREASLVEHDQKFQTLSLEEKKATMIEKDYHMKEHIDKDLERMHFQEILPGRERIHMQGLSDELRELGAEHLTTIMTSGWQDGEDDQYLRLCMLLKYGFLSTQMRDDAKATAAGLNSKTDWYGSNDSVFTQLATKSTDSYNDSMYSYLEPNGVRLKINLDAVNSISYQYHDDAFGIRNTQLDDGYTEEYLERPEIHDFVKEQVESPTWDHEVMIKDSINPNLIEGIVLHTQEQKETVLGFLKEANLVLTNEEGQETILGKNLVDFIQVGQEIRHV